MINDDMSNENKGRLRSLEDSLLKNADRLDSIEQRLSRILEDASPRVQHIAELAERELRELGNIKREAGRIISPYVSRMRSKPVFWSVGLLAGIGLIGYFLSRNQNIQDYSGESFEDSIPPVH